MPAASSALALFLGLLCVRVFAEAPQVSVSKICIGALKTPITIETVSTPEARSKGLRGRAGLEEFHGMLFWYPDEQPVTSGFWMFEVPFSLDLAFISEDGKIVSSVTMAPCMETIPGRCRGYYSAMRFRSALELPAGFLEEHGIEVGDFVRPAVSRECISDL